MKCRAVQSREEPDLLKNATGATAGYLVNAEILIRKKGKNQKFFGSGAEIESNV